MLRELRGIKQVAGEPYRRWFHSEQLDLVLWGDSEQPSEFDSESQIAGFQLCYDKPDREKSITWRRGKGWFHAAVDDGEQTPLTSKTPILKLGGQPPVLKLIQKLHEQGAELPQAAVLFIQNRLLTYPAP